MAAKTNDSATETQGKKRQRSKRDVIYKAVPAGTKVETCVQSGEDWTEDKAVAELRAKMGKDCIIEGPFYKVKGNAIEKDSISVKVSLRDLRMSTKQYEGVHAGWNFYANGIKKLKVGSENFADNDLVQIEFESPVDEDNRQPKPKFGRNTLIRRSALEDCREVG